MSFEEEFKNMSLYERSNFFREYLRKSRSIQEKILFSELINGVILNGEDFLLIEKFLEDHNLNIEGMGFKVFIAYIFNYYKINSSEISLEGEKKWVHTLNTQKICLGNIKRLYLS